MSNKELFVKAFLEAEKIEYAPFLDDSVEWEVSKDFERKMNALINKNNHIKLSSRRRISRSLIAAVIAILIAFAGTMSVSAARAPFVEFVEKVFSKYIEVTVSKDSTLPVETIETEYTLSDVPNGYKISRYDKNEYSAMTTWSKGDKIIIFDQSVLGFENIIDDEHNYEKFELNGYTAYYFDSSILFTDGEYWFDICATGYDKTQLLELAEKIVEKN